MLYSLTVIDSVFTSNIH